MVWWQQPFFQVALPIVFTFILATWYQSGRFADISKRIDDLCSDINARFGDFGSRFDRIEQRLDRLEAKVEAIRERTWR